MIALALMLAGPQAHDMGGMAMPPGMAMPDKAPARAKAQSVTRAKTQPATRATAQPATRATARPTERKAVAKPEVATPPACPPEHAAMGHCKPARPASSAMPDMDMGPSMPTVVTQTGAVGTDQTAGNAAPPPAPATRAADAFYDPATIAAADRAMRTEHGGMRFGQVIANIAEARIRAGRNGYRWDGEGWFGGDIDRLVVKSQGEGAFGDPVESAEVQALYSRAIDPYWNMQAGVRQDLGAGARRTYATLGVEGLAPYWFDVEAALFVSDKGDVLARIEAWYDQRITQRLILQPRIELNASAQDMPASRIGAGLSSSEIGVRLRYETKREIAPYLGVSWERRYGDTARFARAAGDDAAGVAMVLGVRGWF